MVRLSVIMPVYNAGAFLQPALDSVLKQSAVRELELICIDDGSADGSSELLDRVALADARMTVLHTPHGGPGVARNAGLAAAKGAYIAFLDADDLMHAAALKAALCKAEAEDLDLLLCGNREIDERGRVVLLQGTALDPRTAPETPPLFSGKSLGGTLFGFGAVTWARLYRADFLRANGLEYPPLSRTEDICFIYPAIRLAERAAVLDVPLVDYRRCPANPSLEMTKSKDPLGFWKGCERLTEIFRTLGAEDEVLFALKRSLFVALHYNLMAVDTVAGFRAIHERLPGIVAEIGLPEMPRAEYTREETFVLKLAALPCDEALTEVIRSERKEIFSKTRTLTKTAEELRVVETSKAYRLGRLLLGVPSRIRWELTKLLGNKS
ncbi:MAG: glycosyltransferase [Clostridia bacterium]|nr:glycosyltransferase [Clostridia bacterium]